MGRLMAVLSCYCPARAGPALSLYSRGASRAAFISIYLLFPAQKLVNPPGSRSSCLHGQDHGSGSGHGVAAGVHALLGGLAVGLIGHDAFPLVGLQALGGGRD